MEHEITLELREVKYLKMLLDNDLFLDKKEGLITPKKQELFRKIETMSHMAQDATLKGNITCYRRC